MLEITAENVKDIALSIKDGRCILCLEKNVNFSSEEHIIPEGLGNKELILPIGIVCDKCNNNCSGFEGKYVHSGLLSFLRPYFINKTKKGKRPVWKCGLFKTSKDKNDNFIISMNNNEIIYQKNQEFKGIDSISEMRVLYKIAYEFLWLLIGNKCLKKEFDETRKIILESNTIKIQDYITYNSYTMNPGGNICIVKMGKLYIIFIRLFTLLYILSMPYTLPSELFGKYNLSSNLKIEIM